MGCQEGWLPGARSGGAGAGGRQGPRALGCGLGCGGLSGPVREWVQGPPQPCLPHCKTNNLRRAWPHTGQEPRNTLSVALTCPGAIRKKRLPRRVIMGQVEEEVHPAPVRLPRVSPGTASSRKPPGPRVWAFLDGRCGRRGLTSVQQGRVLAQGPQAVERAQPLEHGPQRGGHAGLARELAEFPQDRELQEHQGQGAAVVHLEADTQGQARREPRPGASCTPGHRGPPSTNGSTPWTRRLPRTHTHGEGRQGRRCRSGWVAPSPRSAPTPASLSRGPPRPMNLQPQERTC